MTPLLAFVLGILILYLVATGKIAAILYILFHSPPKRGVTGNKR